MRILNSTTLGSLNSANVCSIKSGWGSASAVQPSRTSVSAKPPNHIALRQYGNRSQENSAPIPFRRIEQRNDGKAEPDSESGVCETKSASSTATKAVEGGKES